MGIGILQRNRSLPFYNSAESEIKSSGAERRSIPNINELMVLLGTEARTSIIDTSEASPNDAVSIYGKLSVLVGQYGAGLTNMIWMPKGSLVVELRGPGGLNGEPWDNCYNMLAESLGHRFKVLEAQEDWHSPIDSERVGKQIKKLIRSSSSPIVSFKDFAKKNWKIS
jgi:capsular polysaccharide biosynthesis protein